MNFELLITILIWVTAFASGYVLGYTRYHSWFMKNVAGRGHYEGGPCEQESDKE